MQQATIKVNPDARPLVRLIGRERTPLIVIDDFATDTSDITRYARSTAEFAADETSAYPGVRARLTRRHVLATLDALYELLYRTYQVPLNLRLKPRNAVYSLVSTPPGRLSLSQSVPHFDSGRPNYFAITHFLGSGDYGGTGFFRHRPTGFEKISEDRLMLYVKAGEAFVAAHGAPSPAYIAASDEHYEMYDRVEWRPNRLVAYPGSLLHSGLIDPRRDVDDDPATGRLTANIFVDFQ